MCGSLLLPYIYNDMDVDQTLSQISQNVIMTEATYRGEAMTHVQ